MTKELYEQDYCGCGEMENRIQEQQRCLFADRTSCHTLRASQFLRCLSSWVESLRIRAAGEIVAVDGQTSRGIDDHTLGGPLHLVRAWATDNRLILGQQGCDEQSKKSRRSTRCRICSIRRRPS